ncbi:DUF6230 family protein [Streptomyces sp. AM 2-1-1]|uniref:DUF6230 family protein n=1 Tax=Streptomyces sp. AM 2-1-1 TaxID=3028709 RepID=UPI0023B96FF1|nr:DUF6230 family protein [Streptomyces sp. AM 2-1-1]WEH39620.1 DUF6230 family protein [Streptomyces sp. AM 2-1-1]
MSSQIRGGTRWKRFALVMVPSVVATAAVGVGLAQGALAASFSISGQDFKVTADQLEGDDFVQYGNVATGGAGNHPVAVSGFSRAEITNMCQSVVTPIPGLGTWTLKLTAGTVKDKPVVAERLYLDVSQLDADAYFEDIDIGVAAGDLGKETKFGIQPKTTGANAYGFAQRSRTATLTNVSQRAWATTAGTFKLSNLSLRLNHDAKECE